MMGILLVSLATKQARSRYEERKKKHHARAVDATGSCRVGMKSFGGASLRPAVVCFPDVCHCCALVLLSRYIYPWPVNLLGVAVL